MSRSYLQGALVGAGAVAMMFVALDLWLFERGELPPAGLVSLCAASLLMVLGLMLAVWRAEG